MALSPDIERLRTTVAPVVPTDRASVRLRPLDLDAVHVESGLWAERRNVSRRVTIPYGLTQLEAAGNLENLRLAAGLSEGPYRGGHDDSGSSFPFLDSDVHKWLEAVGWELGQGPDEGLSAAADPVIELLAAAQRDDGYLDSYFQVKQPGQEFTDLQWGHELYTLGHLVQAAIAWHRAAGDDRLLGIAERAVDLVDARFGPRGRAFVDGHPEIEMALVELYRTTGEPRHLELARTFVERRGHGLLGEGRFGARYWQDHEPVRSAPDPVGHAVRHVYLDCGAVDLAVETGDPELLRAVIQRWERMVASKTYLTGALGSRHRDEAFGDPFELPPDRAYAETCAAIGSVMLAWRLLLATGESRFADMIERTAFNAVLPGLSADGRSFFYSNPLQRRSGGGVVVAGAAAATRRSPWFACSCCPPNIMRFLATMPNLVATSDERGIQIHQFAGSTITAAVRGGTVRMRVRTDYPWDGQVDVEVLDTIAAPWTLTVRIPSWSEDVTADIGGSPLRVDGGRSIRLERVWAPGDHLRMRFDMRAAAIEPDPRIDAVRGAVAIERGPLVYAIEDRDVPAGMPIECLRVELPLDASPTPGTPPGLPDGVVPLTVVVSAIEAPEASWPYRAVPGGGHSGGEPAAPAPLQVQAIPYFAWGNRQSTSMRVWLPAHVADDGARRPGADTDI